MLLKKFCNLTGKLLKSVEVEGDSAVIFTLDDGSKYALLHEQDCCEDVHIEDVDGDLAALSGAYVISAQEVSNVGENFMDDDDEKPSVIWTFYKLLTTKGFMTIRWWGASSGYYSEAVDWVECKEADDDDDV